MSPLTMLLLFLLMAVVVAVHELSVVVLVGMPVGAMFPLTGGTAAVVMGDVVMVVGVQLRLMSVLGLFTFALGTLHFRHLLGVCSYANANLEAVRSSQPPDAFADFVRAVEDFQAATKFTSNLGSMCAVCILSLLSTAYFIVAVNDQEWAFSAMWQAPLYSVSKNENMIQ